MNTTLAASGSGLTALLLGSLLTRTYDLRLCCNGVLSGLVTVTAMCGFVDPYAAVVCGAVAGACYIGFSKLMVRRWFGWGVEGEGEDRAPSVEGGRGTCSKPATCCRADRPTRHLPTQTPTRNRPDAAGHRRPPGLWRRPLLQRAAGDDDAVALCKAGACGGADGRRRGVRRRLLHAPRVAAAGDAGAG
jgi:hypothetical protein